MISLNLTRHELHVLSNFSRIPLGRDSMLLDKQLEEVFEFEGEDYFQAYQRMVRDGFIKGAGKEEALAKEFEALFMVVLRPEWSLQVRKLVEDDWGAVTFSFNHGFGAMIEQSDDGSAYSISYPYTRTGMDSWIKGSLFDGLTFSGPAIQQHELSLSMDECLYMDMLLSILRNRVMTKKGPLERAEAIITAQDMAAFGRISGAEGILMRGLGQEDIGDLFANSVGMAKVQRLLTDKGIIELNQGGILISGLGREIFNPGKIRDCILISEAAASGKRLSALYILTDGYLTMETKGSGEYMVNEVKSFAGDTPVEVLLQGLTSVCFRRG